MAGLYLHIPFCKKRCLYCDFFSNTDMSLKKDFIPALVAEMGLRKDYLQGEALETIYFGGGTPSQLNGEDFNYIFEAVASLFDLSGVKEITLEANPDDMTPEYVKSLKDVPFNRISMGIQSFDPQDLLFLHRRHTWEQAIRAVGLCKENGFENISIDLIYGLPGQTATKWEQNLKQMFALDIPHISAYHLTYEEGTALYKLLDEEKIRALDENDSLQLFELLIDRLADAGYRHYEISNFARPGFLSRHNSSYWEGKKYLGLGPSAHSYNGTTREWNVASLSSYIYAIQSGKPQIEQELLTPTTLYNDYIITRLRTDKGINISEMKMLFGEPYTSYCLEKMVPYLEQNILIRRENRVSLSRRGIFLSDAVMRELIWV